MDMDLLSNYWKNSDPYNFAVYPNLKKHRDEFKIMLLTDIQLEYFSNSGIPKFGFSAISQSLNMIAEDIKTYQPDLLILPGDNIAGAGFFKAIEGERLITFLDSFKIPYAPIIGNHDGEGYFAKNDDNREEFIAKIFGKGRYSLFQRGPVNLGVGNYRIHTQHGFFPHTFT